MPISIVNSLIGHVFDHSSSSGTGSQARGQQQSSQLSKEKNNSVDKVELSAAAPKPLSANLLEQAYSVATKLNTEENLSAEETTRIHSEQVFAAVSVLLAMGIGGEEAQGSLPLKLIASGLPAPSAEELKTAFRRIHQRVDNLDNAQNPQIIRKARQQTISQLRTIDFTQITEKLFG